jgi:hypothetical protein
MEPAKLILPTTSLWTWKRWRLVFGDYPREVDRPYPDRSAVYHFRGSRDELPTTTQLKNEENSVEFVKPRTSGMRIKKKTVCPTIQKKRKNIWNTEQFTAKKYCVKTDYGVWDSEFTMETLKSLSANTIKTQRRRDDDYVLWSMEDNGVERTYGDKFKQVRMIIWSKSNPQPLNSSELSNELPWNCLGRN